MHRLLRNSATAALLLALPLALLAAPHGRPAAAASGGASLPVFGTLARDGRQVGTFQGRVSQLAAADQGGLALSGVLDGLAQIGSDTVRIAQQAFTSPVKPAVVGAVPADAYARTHGGGAGSPAAGGTPAAAAGVRAFQAQPPACDVLYLDVQPIHLDLLGLVVQTSRITLDVSAVPGPGKLLGNLVCALANLLNGTPNAVAQIANQLNQTLTAAGVGSAAAAAAGTAPTAQATGSATTGAAPAGTTAQATSAPTETPVALGTPTP